jgi:hypothetical protein
LREAREYFDGAYFNYQMQKENGNITQLAEKVGIERTHLYRKLKQLGIDLARGARRTERLPEELPPAAPPVRHEAPVYVPRDEYED